MKTLLVLVGILTLSACGSTATYSPSSAARLQDHMRNPNPHLNCPTNAVVMCDIEGGAIAGRTYSNCRCVR